MDKLTITVQGENTNLLIRKTLIQLLRFGIVDGDMYYTGNWHEPATDDERNCGRYYGTKHSHDCTVQRELYGLLTKYQDNFFKFNKADGELHANDVHDIVKTLGSYKIDWDIVEDESDEKVVDLTVHSKFAKYK